MAILIVIFRYGFSPKLIEVDFFLCMYLTSCGLKNNIEFSLAPLFTLVWLTVKTTQCMIIRKLYYYDLLLTICKQCAKDWFIPTNSLRE